ncbi:MAG: HAMP domain-containing histidine kinase [Mucilaginibacter polytrichastri]|nr:HAMP domain-containing histidine kinase [Mucilaginibacter polytrichastri]
MKLVDKFTLWFIAVVILITPVSMFISFSNIRNNIDDAEISHIRDQHTKAAHQIREKGNRNPAGIAVSRWLKPVPTDSIRVSEKTVYNADINRHERYLSVSTFHQTPGGVYRISSTDYVPRYDQILGGMINAVIWKILLIVLGVAITARLISRYVLSSFSHTLKSIRGFDLRSARKIELKSSNVTEFRELNAFLTEMTDKAMEDFSAMKEFSENASHELQTPLAVIRSKIELLTETIADERQAKLIGDMQNAVEKLTRINSSLVLLTRLENHEYQAREKVCFSKLLRDVLAAYSDRLQLKSLRVHTDIGGKTPVHIHPALGDMLINNLLGNAIRHNYDEGEIRILLSEAFFTIKNTGSAPEFPTEELFQRFKKGNQSTESIGLGLSIVKRICDMNGFSVGYTYDGEWHNVGVSFLPAGHTRTIATDHFNAVH